MNVRIFLFIYLCAVIVICSIVLGVLFLKTIQSVKSENLEESSKVVRATLQEIRDKVSRNAESFFQAEIVDFGENKKSGHIYLVNESGKPLTQDGKTIELTEDLIFSLLTGDPVPTIIAQDSRLLVRVIRAKDFAFDTFLVYEEDITNQIDYAFTFISNLTKEIVKVGNNIELPVSDNLLKVAQSSWNPVSTSARYNNKQYLVVATPFLDNIGWHTEGIIVVGLNVADFKARVMNSLYLMVIIVAALMIICLFIVLLSKAPLLSSRLCSVLVLISFVFITFFLKESYDRFSQETVSGFSRSLNRYMEQYAKSSKNLVDLTRIFNLVAFDENEKLISSSTAITANLKKEINTLAKLVPSKDFYTIRGLKIFVFKTGETKMGYLPLRVNTQGKNLILVFFVVLSSVAFALFALDFVIRNIRNRLVLRNTIKGYAFLIPGVFMFMMWLLIPIVFSLYLSFHEWSMVDPLKPFVGFGNFVNVFKDKDIMRSLKNTAVYTLNVPIGMALSLGVALLMNKKIKGINILRLLYFLPSISSFVAISIVWQWIYNPEFGLLNYLLGFFKVPPQRWLSDPKTAMMSIMIMTIWMNLGYQMVIYLAGLKGIPSYLYEVADLDGANSWNKFLYITLPMLQPTNVFLLITSIIGSFQVFTPVYVMTQGGPAGTTNVFVYHIYNTAWKSFSMGYASAQSWFLFLLIFTASFIQFKLMGKTFYEE
ncbi:MAG: carbohydrate ABC transporter permease [Pseudothermotoga sp.]